MTVMIYVPRSVGEGYFTDVPVPGSGDDEKALTYDHATGKFVYAAFDAAGTAAAAVAAHVAASDPHGGYLLESGTRTGASSQRQVFTNGIVTGTIRPASDSTTALRVQTAGGADLLTADTTNRALIYNNGTTKLLISSFGPIVGDGRYIGIWAGDDANSPTTGNNMFNAINSGTEKNTYFNAPSAIGKLFFRQNNATFMSIQSSRIQVSIQQDAVGDSAARLNLLTDSSASKGLVLKGAAAQSANLQEFQNASGDLLASFGATGIVTINPRSSLTATQQPNLVVGYITIFTPTACFSLVIAAMLEISTTDHQDAGRLTWEWVTATHASRASRGKLTAYYTSTEQTAMAWDGDTGGLKLGFYGGTPVAKAAAYTQTYSTADRTLAAYTADNESGAYSGIDNAQVGSVYAQLSDVNALRVAYENLRAFVEDLAQHHNSLLDDMQALNLVG